MSKNIKRFTNYDHEETHKNGTTAHVYRTRTFYLNKAELQVIEEQKAKEAILAKRFPGIVRVK